MSKFQDLPDEVVLKILSYSETKDLIICGQVAKMIRRISRDSTLWVTVNLEKKIVKSELLELILSKGCKILNVSNSTILGHLSSNIKSQLSVLYFSQPVCKCDIHCEPDCDENTGILETLLSSCCLLQHLVLEDIFLTSKMAVSICKNGKTLQILNLKHSYFEDITDNTYLQEIIKCCQEVKEVDLSYINDAGGLTYKDLEFLAQNISPNVEQLNLTRSYIKDDHVEVLLRRCNKIKALSLEPLFITDDSLINIRHHLHLTLEELSLGPKDDRAATRLFGLANMSIFFPSLLELKSMPRLKTLNLGYNKDDCEGIQNLRQHLPHLMIKGVLN